MRSGVMSFLYLLLFVGYDLSAQDAQTKIVTPITASRIEGEIMIDGLSDEPAWKAVQPIQFFVLEPVYGASPSERSELLVTYDSKYLYVAARLYYQDSNSIIARNFVRDGWRGDDWFAFDIDAKNDKQNAIRFALYPFGTHFDMAISNDAVELGSSTFNTNYNLIWEGKSVLTNEGWFSEMKIPFSALRFKPKGNQTIMNISATRQSYHNNERQHFPKVPQTVVDAARKPSLKHPFIFENLVPSKLFYVTPSISTGLTRVNKWNFERKQYRPELQRQLKPSLDIKYSLSPQIIADLTVNTDFSQAEADEQQFNLSRFSLFYPEKRIFFQEQAGLFEFKLGSLSQLFYSRNIGLKEGHIIPIIGGARLTGNLGKTEFGIINIQTARKSINDSTTVTTENFSILRTRNKVWNESSYIGTMFTGKANGKNTNIAAGTDAVIKIKGQHYLMGGIAITYDNANKASLINSSRASIAWDLRKQDKLFYTFQYTYSGKAFNPGIGFVDRSNFHNLSSLVSYGQFARERKGWFRYKKVTWNNDSYWNAGNGKYESMLSAINLSGTTFREHRLSLKLQANYEYIKDTLSFGGNLVIPSGSYFFNQIIATYEAPEYFVVRFPLSLSAGSFYDGHRLALSTGPGWSINKYFELQSKYTLEYLSFGSRQIKSVVHLASIKLEWAFNLHLSGQVLTQYNSAVNRILTNGRIRYHFSDGHDFYAVFNQSNYADRFKETPTLPSFEQQQLLIKYLYTFH